MNVSKTTGSDSQTDKTVTFGVCAAGDPRVDEQSRNRVVNILQRIANAIGESVKMPDGRPVRVVWAPTLIDNEKIADLVARQFLAEHVDAIICTPDTWAFPQLTIMSLLAHFPATLPVNLTCGNSAPKPGVVFAHALNGALAQTGRLAHLNVGNWPDEGMDPLPTLETLRSLVDWCYAALTFCGLKGRRLVIFGHDSMGMETALAHVMPTRSTFGLEITRLDMKLLADCLQKKAYDQAELKVLVRWIKEKLDARLDLSQPRAEALLEQSLAMYLIMRNLMQDLNAVAGGFMNQLEWGSDPRGIPLPICDMAESLFNSTFDHNGSKPVLPFGTEADTQGTLTMLFMSWLSGGNPPLFMDFRKVWEGWELKQLAAKLGVKVKGDEPWITKGLVDGDNSGSASLNWAGVPGDTSDTLMSRVSMPAADIFYFPGGGNSVSFITPGGSEGIAGRLAYSALSGIFSLFWDEAFTVDLPAPLAKAVAASSTPTWPHTWVIPKYASMTEYKQYAPANHFHMTWQLPVARLQYWLDLANVLSVNPWQARPAFIEKTDRPLPLLYLLNGGEQATKKLRASRGGNL